MRAVPLHFAKSVRGVGPENAKNAKGVRLAGPRCQTIGINRAMLPLHVRR